MVENDVTFQCHDCRRTMTRKEWSEFFWPLKELPPMVQVPRWHCGCVDGWVRIEWPVQP